MISLWFSIAYHLVCFHQVLTGPKALWIFSTIIPLISFLVIIVQLIATKQILPLFILCFQTHNSLLICTELHLHLLAMLVFKIFTQRTSFICLHCFLLAVHSSHLTFKYRLEMFFLNVCPDSLHKNWVLIYAQPQWVNSILKYYLSNLHLLIFFQSMVLIISCFPSH